MSDMDLVPDANPAGALRSDAAMKWRDQGEPHSHGDRALLRREFLWCLAATGLAAALWPGVADASTEVWEEGDLQCQPPVSPVTPSYDVNDPTLLRTFMQLSETLTGVRPLDEHIGRKYLERFARHPQLTTLLPRLAQAYRSIARDGRLPADALVDRAIMKNSDLRTGAEQIIFVWYLSAFYLLPPAPAASSMNPVPRAPAKPVWIYGSPEEYAAALIWPLIHAHAPMTPGGPPGYWADPPSA